MEKCLYKEKNEEAEKEISEMKKVFESEKFEESYIRKLIGGQKGELNVESNYYKGNIAEGNWSLIENDSTIKKMDENKEEYRTVDAMDVLLGLDKYQREKDAEYEYVFIPSYYAINILIFYYLENMENAKKIYGLKNAVVTRKNEKFFGGLPFILKYIGGDYKDRRIDLDKIIDKVFDLQDKLSNDNSSDEFINDIIDCINNFYQKDLTLEKRVDDFKHGKDNWFTIDFYQEMKDKKINYIMINDYKILMHRDVDKDWKHLRKNEILKAQEKISKTPNHPNNDSIIDSEALTGNLKGWFSQRITQKDRLVYRIEKNEKKVYIATVCGHYINASKRIESMSSYK